MSSLKGKSLTIFILGLMTALSPFSIDMYLPAFQTIAQEFNTTVARISLSLSSYFVGISLGQLFYGPLLDRFGRKRPLYVGIAIYIVASFCCLAADSTETLVAWRFVQAIGGCVASVGAMAMVRDLFTLKESGQVYSLLILILGASPLLAPTIGGYLSAAYGWHSVFILLAIMAIALLLIIKFFLPESHQPDVTVSLKVAPIAKTFVGILRNSHFYTYAGSCAVAFSGLFVYLAGSPVIFLETYKVTGTQYGWIFAIVASGMIGASQLNVILLRRFSNQQMLMAGMSGQFSIGLVLAIGTAMSWFDLNGTVFMMFLFMACFGLTNPNGGALALEPFAKNAGSASALMGFMQMGTGALASTSVGILGINQMLPIVATMAGTSGVALMILTMGSRHLKRLSRTHKNQ